MCLGCSEDSDDAALLQALEILGRTLEQEHVAEAQGNIAQFANHISSMVIDAEDLRAVALAKTLSAQGAS